MSEKPWNKLQKARIEYKDVCRKGREWVKKWYGFAKVFTLCFLTIFVVLMENSLKQQAGYAWITQELNEEEEFRETRVNNEALEYMKEKGWTGAELGAFVTKLYFFERISGTSFSKDKEKELEAFDGIDYVLKQYPTEYEVLKESNEAIWGDLQYFPVAVSTKSDKMTVNYGDSWKFERTFGGKRYHEGCDIMADVNVRGIYPVVSISDGVVEKKGWLPKGGYRLGIRGEHGAYFYYAHLESYADIETGDYVRAGQLLGFMGDSGYGEEGTVGQFAVHLHVGIYIPTKNNAELSINPYPVLKYLEANTIAMDYDQ